MSALNEKIPEIDEKKKKKLMKWTALMDNGW